MKRSGYRVYNLYKVKANSLAMKRSGYRVYNLYKVKANSLAMKRTGYRVYNLPEAHKGRVTSVFGSCGSGLGGHLHFRIPVTHLTH